MNKKDVMNGDELRDWPYLEKVAQTLPGVKEIPLGLLIGNNCPKAQEPVEVVSSQGNGPYATRTRLGWCVSAASQNEGVSKVVETRVRDISISTALQEM